MANEFSIKGTLSVEDKLKEREDYVENGDKTWLYKKRAFVTIEFIGTNTNIDCTFENYRLESDSVKNGSYTGGLTKVTDGRRVPNPILESVSIKNTSAGDISDVSLFQIEFSYKVFSLDDLNNVERSFMIQGNRVLIKGGWHPYGNSIDMLGVITGFGFTGNSDGSFSCTGKAIAESSLMGAFKVFTVDDSDDVDEAEEENKTYGFTNSIEKAIDETFGIERDDDGDVDEIDNASGRAASLQLKKIKSTVLTDLDYIRCGYAKIKLPKRWYQLFSDDGIIVTYISLGALVDYINRGFLKGKKYKFEIKGTFTNSSILKSADPKLFLLPLEQASYFGFQSVKDDDKVYNLLEDIGGDPGMLEDIMISTYMLNEIEKELDSNNRQENRGYDKTNFSNFFSIMFKMISENTGKAVDLRLIPTPAITSDSKEAVTGIIINMSRDVKVNKIVKPYEFKHIGKRSILRDVSLSSELDSELITMATINAKGDSKIPLGAIEKLFNGVYGCKPKDTDSNGDETTKKEKTPLEMLESATGKLGKNYTDSSVSSMKSALKKWFMTEPSNSGFVGYVRYAISLSVTIDGIWGIQFYDSFSFDRLPASLKKGVGNGIIYFVVTEQEHEISNGDWKTTIKGAMQIKANNSNG